MSHPHSTSDDVGQTFNISCDHGYATVDSPRKLKRKMDETVDSLEKCKKQLKTEKQKTRRLKQKVSSLKSVVDSLREKNLISTNCAEMLESNFGAVPREIFERILDKKEGRNPGQYPEELKAFAMTLQFYSTKAYEYVRETFDMGLPHPSHIRSWYSEIDGDPGFTKSAFAALETKAKENSQKGEKTICAVMLDEMAIRKHVEYSNGKYHGYVDVGTGVYDDATPMAKDALVLMAVCVNGSWKIPLGYFLIDGMTGVERANLVQDCFQRLHDCGVTAVSLTCDGPSCHFSMMKALGANMNVVEMDPSFPHPANPSTRVHIILDVCHMLKLLRNSLADIGILKSASGQYIKWQYIDELDKLQESEGLRLGNKLRNAHLQWRRQKMKVNLAAQVFSASVADALEYCNKNLKLPQFKGCEATVQFLRHVDAAFDVLNSRNPLGKGTKAPLNKKNKDRMLKVLKDAEAFILGITDVGGKPIYLTPRRTGFIGFVASIKSIIKLFEDLVLSPNAPMSYLLTYKFSQDHLELFFSAVRGKGGFNNNPTAIQFKAAYKRLLMRHKIKFGTGNCLVLDDTTILESSTKTQSTVSVERKYDLLTREPVKSDHDYTDTPNIESVSEFKQAAINYIAGYVVKMMQRTLKCMACSNALTTSRYIHPLTKLKDRGGLLKPSESVVSICLETEKCFQRMLKASNGKLPQGFGISKSISTAVLSNCANMNLFADLNDHQFETSVTDNHIHHLVKLVAQSYSKIKMYHLGKQTTASNTGPKVRKNMAKLILFKHQ